MTSKLLKVEGHVGIVRDTNVGSIISTDTEAYAIFREKKEKERQHVALSNKVESLEEKIISIEDKLSLILAKLS